MCEDMAVICIFFHYYLKAYTFGMPSSSLYKVCNTFSDSNIIIFNEQLVSHDIEIFYENGIIGFHIRRYFLMVIITL